MNHTQFHINCFSARFSTLKKYLTHMLSLLICMSGPVMATSDIDEILKSLSLEEKVGQLNLIPIEGDPTPEQLELIRKGLVGGVLKANGVENNLALQKVAVEESRTGIPILFQEDVIHGYKTIAPIPLAEAASWDLEAIRKSAAVAAREASAAGVQLTYAPMVDITRDPRWGRILEGAGEDPYLGSLVAKARIEGFQNSGKKNENILACVKHFAGYGAALAGRDYNIRDISERELREIHLPPFQAAFDAGVDCTMGAYTAFDGIPATAHTKLMNDILRKEMGFDGLLMTDWETIPNLVKTGIAENNASAVTMAMKSGFDMDMTSKNYITELPALVKNGSVTEQQLNRAVRQVLKLKDKAGLLDDPYSVFDKKREKKELMSKRNWKETKDIALKSMVLLKNTKNILPIKKNVKSIAVIGPFAKSQIDLLGWWHAKGKPEDVVTIYDGIDKEFGRTASITYAKGVEINKFEKAGADLIPEAVKVAKASDLAIVVLGEEHWMSGEGGGVASLRLPGLQESLLAKVKNTGTPVITIIVTGRPYVLTEVATNSDALLQAWMPGTTGGEAVAEILKGKFNPTGRLPVTFPYHQGQIPIFHSYKKSSHSFDAGPDNNRFTATHRDIPHEPLYPFGYGLSYTTFDYSKIRLSSTELKKGGKITASVDIKNTGKRKGREIVQLYLHDKVASVTRPLKELKGFSTVDLKPGQSKTVKFNITDQMLSYIGPGLKNRIDLGEFELYIGRNSEDTQSLEFTLVE